MNFTREPIIETVITPREGCTLVICNSKGGSQEEYLVESIEVVSFGNALFFRSQERPKPFLVPVSDYEVIEVKETRMALKNIATERAIKIGGGREAPPRPREESPQDAALADSRPAPVQDQRPSGKQGNKRRRGRRGRDRDRPQDHYPRSDAPPEAHAESHEPREESAKPPEDHLPAGELPAEKAPSFISKLFPPPSTLIKDTIGRYKPPEEPTPSTETSWEYPADGPVEDDNEE